MVMTDFIADFLRGQRDCKKGIPAPVNASEDYMRGYGAQYTAEQIADEQTERQINEHYRKA
jgi:hypothetical protein